MLLEVAVVFFAITGALGQYGDWEQENETALLIVKKNASQIGYVQVVKARANRFSIRVYELLNQTIDELHNSSPACSLLKVFEEVLTKYFHLKLMLEEIPYKLATFQLQSVKTDYNSILRDIPSILSLLLQVVRALWCIIIDAILRPSKIYMVLKNLLSLYAVGLALFDF